MLQLLNVIGTKSANKVARAFIEGRRLHIGNYSSTGEAFLLFGNTIAQKIEGGFIIQDCGYCSQTTCSALNCLPSVRLRKEKFKWIWNEERTWDGKAMFIEYGH